MDTKAIRSQWAEALCTNSQEVAVNPAKLAAVVAEGIPDGLELPVAEKGCTHVVVSRATLQAIVDHEPANKTDATKVQRPAKSDVGDQPKS